MHLQDFPVIAKGTMSDLLRSFHQSFYNKKKPEGSQMDKDLSIWIKDKDG